MAQSTKQKKSPTQTASISPPSLPSQGWVEEEEEEEACRGVSQLILWLLNTCVRKTLRLRRLESQNPDDPV